MSMCRLDPGSVLQMGRKPGLRGPGVANMASWEVLDYLCGSNHSLRQIELEPYIQYEEIYNSRQMLKRANWKCFLRSVI